MSDSSEFSFLQQSCERCQFGVKKIQLVTFITWIGEEIITVPDFPAWVCDMCGHRRYDDHALLQLSLVLHPDAGKPLHIPLSNAPVQLHSTKNTPPHI